MSQRKAPDLLIISASARALLESASRAGYQAIVIDGFNDSEVQQLAVAADKVALDSYGCFDDDSLTQAITAFVQHYAHTLKGIVVASGIDGCQNALRAIRESGVPLWSNALEWLNRTVAPYQDERLAVHLGDYFIPARGGPQLLKSYCASGGGHIRYATADPTQNNRPYYQQAYLPGVAISHLFLADGHDIQTVGFSTQWHSRHCRTRPFCYGGAINRHLLDKKHQQQAETLARRLKLRGLNNIDYLFCAAQLYFLELNARPSATFCLYDADYPKGLLHAHIEACRGKLSAPQPQPLAILNAVLYAEQELSLPSDFEWPSAARDIPVAGTDGYYFPSQAPICTLQLQRASSADALSALQESVRKLQGQLFARSSEQAYFT